MQSGLQLGRYRLLERIAAGGMAEIYLADQEAKAGLSRKVVIKTILPQYTRDATMRTMLHDEARIGFSLQHRNIVQVVDVGDEQDLLYIAMEYVEGANLAQLSEVEGAGGASPVRVLGLVAHIGMEVLAALDYAHNRTEDERPLEIVHRDVSPQNILISTAGEVKLSDFGIALARDRITKTTTGGVKGKLAYIPPEQATADTVGPQADVFSAAAVLFELLTGRGPYEATTDIGILKAIESGAIGRVANARPDVPKELAAAIDRALSADAAERPTAGEFRRQLEPFALPSSEAELALKEHATTVHALLMQQSHQQRRFENALLKQGDGPSAVTEHLTSNQRPVHADKAPRKLPLVWFGTIAIAAAIAAYLLWPGDELSEPSVASLPRQDATLIAERSDSKALGQDAGLSALIDSGQAVVSREPPAKPLPTRNKHGFLSIHSFPWAEVEVDGKKVGNTPLRRLRLRVGKHKVVLRNPQSGKRVQRTVKVKPGKSATLRIEL